MVWPRGDIGSPRIIPKEEGTTVEILGISQIIIFPTIPRGMEKVGSPTLKTAKTTWVRARGKVREKVRGVVKVLNGYPCQLVAKGGDLQPHPRDHHNLRPNRGAKAMLVGGRMVTAVLPRIPIFFRAPRPFWSMVRGPNLHIFQTSHLHYLPHHPRTVRVEGEV